MKLKYKLKLSRPKARGRLTGKRVLQGDCFVDVKKDGSTCLRNGAKKDEVLMYWSPSAMYAHHAGKVPRSILDKVTIMMNNDSMEVCYTRHNTDAHPSLFLSFSTVRDVCNVYMDDSSAIIALQDIDSSSVVRLTCYYNNWSSLNASLEHFFPQRFLKLNDNYSITYLQAVNKNDKASSMQKKCTSIRSYTYTDDSNIDIDDDNVNDYNDDTDDDNYVNLWYKQFKDEYSNWMQELNEY